MCLLPICPKEHAFVWHHRCKCGALSPRDEPEHLSSSKPQKLVEKNASSREDRWP
jgi:hypothetical protein